jgi:hypothetical protein
MVVQVQVRTTSVRYTSDTGEAPHDDECERPENRSGTLRAQLPIRARNHGLHRGIVSCAGIHGLEVPLASSVHTVDGTIATAGHHSGLERPAEPCVSNASAVTSKGAAEKSEVEISQTFLPDDQLWRACAEKVPDWSYWYATYYHFRSKVRPQLLCIPCGTVHRQVNRNFL